MITSPLKIGDRVRIVAIPAAVRSMPPETRDGPDGTLTVLMEILRQRAICEIVEIMPENGWPWIAFAIADAERGTVCHKLVVEPECVERVAAFETNSPPRGVSRNSRGANLCALLCVPAAALTLLGLLMKLAHRGVSEDLGGLMLASLGGLVWGICAVLGLLILVIRRESGTADRRNLWFLLSSAIVGGATLLFATTR